MQSITGFDQQSYGYFSSKITPWSSGFTDKVVSNYKSFCFPGKIEDLPSWYMSTNIYNNCNGRHQGMCIPEV